MKHSMSQYIYYCKWCGQSLEDLADVNQEECNGTKGVYHIQYLRIQKEVDKMMKPIFDRLGIK
jgi:hypothetical protein